MEVLMILKVVCESVLSNFYYYNIMMETFYHLCRRTFVNTNINISIW